MQPNTKEQEKYYSLREIERIQDEWDKWASSTFGEDRDPIGIANHLKEEADEFKKQVEVFKKEPTLGNYRELLFEGADVLGLLLNTLKRFDIDANALITFTKIKLDINKQREWQEPDENGIYRHK
jgi:hypothetical protein